ncbi:MAG TPA: hypothetical protein VHS58_02000 [Acetobacteraceae bacterium]|nr:hypothetical protein [Acetobacteraceae bacterium]
MSSKLKPHPSDIYKVEDHLRARIARTGQCANAVRKNIDDADEAGDAKMVVVFAQVSRGLDKWLWFLEAHMPARRTRPCPAPAALVRVRPEHGNTA